MNPGRTRARFLGVCAGLAASTAARAPARAAQFELKCATSLPAEHPANVRLGQMWASIEAESGGRVRTQLFPNSQLGGDSSMLTQVRTGAIAFFMNNPGILASILPLADIYQLGFAFKDEDEAFAVSDGPLGAYVSDQVETKNLHLLRAIWNSGMFVLGSNIRPIRTPGDVHDFKVRIVESHITVDLFKTLGASPVVVSGGELYTALQTKIVDGESMPLTSIDSFKLYEVNKYISVTNHQWAGLSLIANGDMWKGLPPDLAQLIERENTRYANLERTDTKTSNASMAQKLAGHGLSVNAVDPAPFRAGLRAYYDAWGATFGSRAMTLLQTSINRKLG